MTTFKPVKSSHTEQWKVLKTTTWLGVVVYERFHDRATINGIEDYRYNSYEDAKARADAFDREYNETFK